MNKYRIIYYSSIDGAYNSSLKSSEELIKRIDLNQNLEINDIVELLNAIKYCSEKEILSDETDNLKIISVRKKCLEFLNTQDLNDFLIKENLLDLSLIESFWRVLHDYNLFKKVKAEGLEYIVGKSIKHLYSVLAYEKIVSYFSDSLKRILLSTPISAELVLRYYSVNDGSDSLFLPKNINSEDVGVILSNYLDWENANINYVEKIQFVKEVPPKFIIPSKIRLKAKKRYEQLYSEIFNDEGASVNDWQIEIRINNESSELEERIFEGSKKIQRYSYDYLANNLSPRSVFNNFKNLFHFVNDEGQSFLTGGQEILDVMEKISGVKTKHEYPVGKVFLELQTTSILITRIYKEFLKKFEVNLEECLETVFKEQLPNDYGFSNNVRLNLIRENLGFDTKTSLIAIEHESMLKQFGLFVKENEVDFELMEYTDVVRFSDVPSCLENKYVYLNDSNKKLLKACNLLFSEHSLLIVNDKYIRKSYKNFFDGLINQTILISDINENCRELLGLLVELELITFFNDEVVLKNTSRILLLKKLFYERVISFHHTSEVDQKIIIELKNKDWLKTDSSLFTKQEVDYLNYYLNSKSFSNGPEIRNKYSHGHKPNYKDKTKYEQDYLTYLNLVILTLLKIEDDLRLSSLNTKPKGYY